MATSKAATKPTSIQQTSEKDKVTPKPVVNPVTKVGNLVRDWELHYAPSGIAVARTALAVNGWGATKGTTTYYELVAFKSLAENLSTCTQKGNRLIVSGKPQTRTWETSEGEKRTAKEILLDSAGIELRFITASIDEVERQSSLFPTDTPDDDNDF